MRSGVTPPAAEACIRLAEAGESLVSRAALRAWGVAAAALSVTPRRGRSRQLSALLWPQVRLRLEIPGLGWV